jgi:aspartyl-tRNA(Asn)/glutamyl-tRNA(Gln) amidotransferase subunit A
VGYAPVDFDEWPEPGLRPEFQRALDVVRQMGVQLREVELPDFPYGALVSTILAGEAGSIFEELIRSGRVDQLADQRQIAGLKAYLDLPAVEYLRAMRVRRLVQAAFRKVFLDVDMLLAPTRLGAATPVSEPLDAGRAGPTPNSRGFSGLIPAGNLCGLPAISLPSGFAGGLPVAISFVGRPFNENQLVALGRAFQQETDWHLRRPQVA